MGNDTLQSILGSKTVSFHSIFAKALGSVPAAVMLSQAFFWQEKAKYKDGSIEIGDRVFFQKTAEDWYDETGLTKEQQLTARKHLRASGIMEEKLAGLPATVHYRVDIDSLVAVINRYLSSGVTVAVNYRNKKPLNPRTGHGKFRQQDTVKNGNYNKEESLEKKGELKGEGPVSEKETFVTTFTPDKIEKEKSTSTLTFTIVKGETFSFDAADYGKDIPGGPGEIPEQPMTDAEREDLHRLEQQSADDANAFYDSLKKETPALQNAGHFEASVPPNPPPIFLNPDLQRRYADDTSARSHHSPVIQAFTELGTPADYEKTKRRMTRKAPAADRTAQICAEITKPEVLDFFHAIHAAWGEWTAYKRREKKGPYKSAETEAATIAALAKAVNYDPEAGRAAIEHSIAHTYQGIYPPKDTAPTAAPAPRYSLEDRPQANTPEQMKEELSRFYNANSALLSEAQSTAGTNYTGDRLRSIVIDFCGNRIAKARQGETFGQHHAALGLWLKRQKEFDAAKNPAQQKHTAGTQPQAPLRSAAPVNYSQQGPQLRSEQKAE